MLQRTRRPDTATWVKHGIIGGIAGGIAFALFEMVVAAATNGLATFWTPMRLIGAIALGRRALDPSFPLQTAVVTGLILHLLLATIFGLIFAGIVAALPMLGGSTAALLGWASVFGLALWLVNVYGLAQVFGWIWFLQANPLIQLVAHTFFYGSVLGWVLAQLRVHQRVPTAV